MTAARAITAAPRQAVLAPPRRLSVPPQPVWQPEFLIQRKCACGGSCPKCKDETEGAIQTKLAIDTAGDAFEQEADRVADEVVRRGHDGAHGTPSPPIGIGGHSRGGHFYGINHEAPIRRKANSASSSAGTLLPHHLGPGQPLADFVRSSMESRFGADFGDVRIHSGAREDQAASSISALAYTVGHDIVFGQGQYQPATESGQRLLAHELTHVLQQERGDVRGNPIQRQSDPSACPTAPTGLGNEPAKTVCPLVSARGTTEIGRWHFCVDSDEVLPPDDLATATLLVRKQPRSARFLIHGHASAEGGTAYNLTLACHRANKVAEAVSTAVQALLPPAATTGAREAIVRDRVQVATRGATTEFGDDPESNRVVVLYAEIPGAATPDEPSCEDAPRHIGDFKPEIPCDPPTIDLTGKSGHDLRHFRFCFDSDVLSEGGVDTTKKFAGGQASTATYFIHGFSSIEGAPDYNRRLSCHRALRIARELQNAGVRPEQIQEVSGLGATDVFSFGVKDTEAVNRVAVVFAKDGKISKIPEGKHDAKSAEDKRAIIDEARDRLLSGQYESAADFYISYWTCGRTPTVREAVERLTVLIPEDNPQVVDPDKDELIRDRANGVEEDPRLGVNAVQVSNTAMRADNAIECVMGRLIDMAFHHAVLASPGLSADLVVPRPERTSSGPPPAPTPSHLAGLHLISLAGLNACKGRHASANVDPAHGPIGIDEPLSDDPRRGILPPECAKPPQPTRLLEPTAADKRRQAPDVAILNKDEGIFHPLNGDLGPSPLAAPPGGLIKNPAAFQTASDVIRATARVALIGNPETFADYEIGFMQTVLDDLLLAEYTTGHIAVQKLPVPIRAAQLRNDVRAPAPWMSSTASARPGPSGIVDVNGAWKLHTEFAGVLNLYRPGLQSRIFVDTLQRHTTVAVWLAMRRLGAPLDRFSTLFLDGIVYDIDQSMETEIHRIRGDMLIDEKSTRHEIDPDTPAPERETFKFTGTFRSGETDSSSTDPRQAQFDTPVASDIDAFRQFRKIVEPATVTKATGLTLEQYRAVVRTILDTLEVQTEKNAKEGKPGSVMPRLGFVFSPLDIAIKVDSRTGRMLPYLNAEDKANPVQITSAGLGDRALYHLARALALRLQKRDFLKTGTPVILAEIPADGIVPVKLPPLMAEPDLSKDPAILRDMAEMWACSDVTRKSPDFLNPKEFAEAWGVDRDQTLIRFPAAPAFFTSTSADEEHISTNIQCGPLRAGFAIGTIHTHPADSDDAPSPSKPDLDVAKTAQCGRQHYIVSEARVVAYYSDGRTKDLGDRASLLPKGVTCNQDIPKEVFEF
jgi:outer membrane protein OmpA-like peptidoglycan-associated protein